MLKSRRGRVPSLKKCYNCGSGDIRTSVHENGGWRISCPRCGRRTRWCLNKIIAHIAWNIKTAQG